MVRRSNRLSRKPRLDYKRYNSTGVIVTKGASPAKRVKSARATGALAQAIRKVVNSSSETKQVCWYSGNGNDGKYSGNGSIAHNSLITSTATDVLRLIPYIVAGTGDNQRIGEKVSPKSLVVTGTLRLDDGVINGVNAESRDDIVVVLYVLQSTTLKSYTAVAAAPSPGFFNNLLSTGEGLTVPFVGNATEAQMPVENAYFKLLSKKKIRLRYAGAIPGSASGVPTNAVVSVSNAHSYYADFNFNLSKHLPAKFTYPEANASALGLNDPTNSSIFMAVGFYNMDGQNSTSQFIQIQYTSQLKFKDN